MVRYIDLIRNLYSIINRTNYLCAKGTLRKMAGQWVECLESGIMLVHGCTVDYDSLPDEAVKGISHWNEDQRKQWAWWALSCPLAFWNGGKSGVIDNVAVPILFPRRTFTNAEMRAELTKLRIKRGVPADLVPLADARISRILAGHGTFSVAALDEDDESLWRIEQLGPTIINLSVRWGYEAFRTRFDSHGDWGSDAAVAGAPIPE
jgi:hypothetical protein